MPFKILIVAILFIVPIAPTIWAILDIPKRKFGSPRKKLGWLFLVSSLPCIGALLYIFLARRGTEPLG